MTPLVSVIIPVYNMQNYLAETLTSILTSSYKQLEVLVMDDGSTDRSMEIAQEFASKDKRVKLLRQANGGVCRARNNAIHQAQGKYILPIDSDDLIAPWFIGKAAEVLETRENVKAVFCQGAFFGGKTGLWKVPKFDIHLLARKNMLCISALYRKEDWQRVGGYCEEMQAREDWEFWIHVLKDGGEVVRLPEVGLRYRIREGSKRVSDRKWKRKVVDTLNRRHPEFFERELGGPLHYYRGWSRLLNRIYRMLHPRKIFMAEGYERYRHELAAMPMYFLADKGEVICDRRNQMRRMRLNDGTEVLVQRFATPNLVNKLIYGFLRPSKAQRSQEYALMLRAEGIGSPAPVGYSTERRWGLFFAKSYYISLASTCPYTYTDIIHGELDVETEKEALEAIAIAAARMHDKGWLHKGISCSNILFGRNDSGRMYVEFIDLNHIRSGKVSVEKGCANLAERLPATASQCQLMATAYARERKANAAQCLAWMKQYNKEEN